MVIADEEHLFDFVKLLETDNVEFTRARCRLYHEAEFFVISLTLGNLVCSHGHTLHVLDVPIALLFFLTDAVVH